MCSLCVGVCVDVCGCVNACVRSGTGMQITLKPLPRMNASDRVRCAVGGWSKILYVPVTRKVILISIQK